MLLKDRSDVIDGRGSGDDASRGIDTLEFMDGLEKETKEKQAVVVDVGRNKGANKNGGNWKDGGG